MPPRHGVRARHASGLVATPKASAQPRYERGGGAHVGASVNSSVSERQSRIARGGLGGNVCGSQRRLVGFKA